MNAKKWFKNCICLVLAALLLCAVLVAWLDPFFHYHAPLKGFYYVLDEQRSQNDGITKHFDYDAVITGTSMTENFKSSEFDALFDTHSIKVPYAGATYKEINENLETAFATHEGIRIVLRGIDLSLLLRDPDEMRLDMGEYPEYLYNTNPFDDVKYLFNRDVLGRYCLPMLVRKLRGVPGGVTDFDTYSFTADNFDYGAEHAFGWNFFFAEAKEAHPLTKEDEEMLRENIRTNLTRIADAHPETTFYYFIPPYSMVYWGRQREEGELDRMLAAERILTQELLQYDNIRLFSFHLDTEITAELSNYHDAGHYSADVNSWMLQCMKTGEGEITKDNADAVLEAQEKLLGEYDYDGLLLQLNNAE